MENVIKKLFMFVILFGMMVAMMMPVGVAYGAGVVTGITVTGAGNVSAVVNGGTLQMSAAVLPVDATDPSVSWSVAAGTGTATINATGLLLGTGVGNVTVTAKANDTSGMTGTKVINVYTVYKLDLLLNNSYAPVTLNTLMANYSPRGLTVGVPKKYLTKFDIAYSTNSTKPLTNVDITAEAEVVTINVKFGTTGTITQAIKKSSVLGSVWNTGYEGSLTTLDDKGQSIGQDIEFEALDKDGKLLEKKKVIKLNVKGIKVDLSSAKSLTVPRTFADLILNNGKIFTDILKQYDVDELTVSTAS